MGRLTEIHSLLQRGKESSIEMDPIHFGSGYRGRVRCYDSVTQRAYCSRLFYISSVFTRILLLFSYDPLLSDTLRLCVERKTPSVRLLNRAWSSSTYYSGRYEFELGSNLILNNNELSTSLN